MIGATRVWVVGEILTAANMNTFLSTLIEDLAGRNGAVLLEGPLEVVGGAGGYFRAPSLTTVQRDNLTPVDGFQVYNSDDNQMQFRENGAWVAIGSHAASHAGGGADDIGGQAMIWTVDQVWNDNVGIVLGTNDPGRTRIFHDGTDLFFDNFVDASASAVMMALADGFPSPDGTSMHIWGGTAGAVTPNGLSRLIVESSSTAAVYLSILGPNSAAKGILFGEPASAIRGQLIYFGSTDTPADTLQFTTAGVARLNISAGAFAFLEATVISCTAGGIDFDPFDGGVAMIKAFNGDLEFRIENTLDGAGDHAILHLEVGGTIPDPKIVFRITDTSTEWSIGIDNTGSDALKISNDVDPGVETAISIATDQKVSFTAAANITDSIVGTFDGLLIENTNTGVTTHARLVLKVSSSSSTADPQIHFDNQVAGGRWTIGVDNSSGDQFSISNAVTLGGGDDALRCSTAQAVTFNDPATYTTFDYVCDKCFAHERFHFLCCGTVKWHDDVLAIRDFVEGRSLKHMVDLGVYTVDGEIDHPSWVGMNQQMAHHYSWACIGQNRERMDSQYDELDARLQAIGA